MRTALRYLPLSIALLAAACGAEGTATETGDGSTGGDTTAATTTGGDTTGGDTTGGDTTGGDTTGASYAETLMAAGWAQDMVLSHSGDTLTIEDDGLPSHPVLEAYLLMDGSTTPVVANPYSMDIPTNPAKADSPTDTNMGAIGVAISGGIFFNPYEGGGDVALDSNFETDGIPFLDTCSGHPLPDGGTYHYHGVPYCVTDDADTEGQHSVLIGVLLDGFAVYGPQGEGGVAPTDLDACSGHDGPTPEFPGGVYHYHTTGTAPYSIPCYTGEVTVSAGGGGPPGGGPPGGGPPGGGPPPGNAE